jgi:hypothetical protein
MSFQRNILFIAALCCPSLLFAQTVALLPALTIPTTIEFTVAVTLETGGDEVMGIEASLSFDSAVVRLERVDPGPWFTGAVQEHFYWDYTHENTELVRFTGALLGSGSSDDGVVAICRFTALAAGVSPVQFLGLEVRGPDNADLGAGHSTGDLIIIEAAVDDRRRAWGTVKAAWK